MTPSLVPSGAVASGGVPFHAHQVDSTLVYVVRRAWHVDIGIDARNLGAPLAQLQRDFPRARSLLFGFGDRRYLTHRGGYLNMLAALWPGPGAVLTTSLIAHPAEAFGADNVRLLSLNADQTQSLLRFVAGTLAPTPTKISDGPYGGSAYYATNFRYSAFFTCNTWVAEALETAGLPIRHARVEFASQLWKRVGALPQVVRAGPH